LVTLVLTCSDGVNKGIKKEKRRKSLFFILGFEHLVLGQHRRNGFCGNGAAQHGGELAAVVNMRNLETDNEAETEAGDAD
jgi:hypothetical protein